jgi:tripartite ATP-independent transporter DctP family solute receptor
MTKRTAPWLALVASATLLQAAPAAAGKIELKLAHYAAESHPAHLAARMFADGVAAATGGQVTVAIFPNSALGNSQEILEQTRLGAVDLALPTEAALAKYVKKYDLVGAPFAFADYAAADRLLDGEFLKWASPDLEAAGLVHLYRWEWGFRNYTTSKRQIQTPADFKGLKIRTPPDFVNQATVEALGGTVQTIAFAELTMALKQGVVDGQENPIGVIYSNKIYETQKFLSLLNYTYASMNLVMNKAAFAKLTPDQQKVVSAEAKKAGDFMRKAVRDEEAKQVAELERLGMQVARPDTAPFKAGTTPVYEKLKAKVGDADYGAFMAMLAKGK